MKTNDKKSVLLELADSARSILTRYPLHGDQEVGEGEKRTANSIQHQLQCISNIFQTVNEERDGRLNNGDIAYLLGAIQTAISVWGETFFSFHDERMKMV